MGQFTAEAMREAIGSDLALLDRGAVQQGLAAGPVKLVDIYRVHPWRNQVVTTRLTGKAIREILTETDLHHAGCRTVRETGYTLTVLHDGQPIEDDAFYSIALGGYLHSSHEILREYKVMHSSFRIDQILRDALEHEVSNTSHALVPEPAGS